ncbi:hypothetical protein [Helicobacter sp. T3_23-1056]
MTRFIVIATVATQRVAIYNQKPQKHCLTICNQKLQKKRYFEKFMLVDCHESANADSRNDDESLHYQVFAIFENLAKI